MAQGQISGQPKYEQIIAQFIWCTYANQPERVNDLLLDKQATDMLKQKHDTRISIMLWINEPISHVALVDITGTTIQVPHLDKSSLCNAFEDQAPVDEIYGCLIFKWVSETWQQQGTRIVVTTMTSRDMSHQGWF